MAKIKLNPNIRRKSIPTAPGVQGSDRLDPSNALEAVDLTYGSPDMRKKIDKAKEMGISVTENNVDQLDRQMALRQPGWKQGVYAVFGGLGSGGLTALENTGYLLDVVGSVKTLAGVEEVNSNWFSDMMKKGKETLTQDIMPIYRENPNEITDFGDWGFYWESVRGIVDSAVGFAIPGMAATKLVGAVQRLARTKALVNAFATTKGNADLINALGSGYITNFMEGKMMGLEVYESTYDQLYGVIKEDLIKKGRDAETAHIEASKAARGQASHAANKFMIANKVFMLTDAFSLRGLYKGTKHTRDLVKKPLSMVDKYKDVNNVLNKIGKYTKDGAAEALEEIGQNVFQEEVKFEANRNLGLNKDDKRNLTDRIIDFATSEQALYEGALGFLGGGPQRLITKVLTGDVSSKPIKDRYNKQQNIIEQNTTFLKNHLNHLESVEQLYKEAIQSDNEAMGDFLKENEFVKTAVRNFQAGTTEALTRSLEDIGNGKDPNFPKDANTKNKALTDLARLNRMEQSWLRSTRYANPGEVFFTIENIATLSNIKKRLERDEAQLQSELNSYVEDLVSNPEKQTKEEKDLIESLPDVFKLEQTIADRKAVTETIKRESKKLVELTSKSYQKETITRQNKERNEAKNAERKNGKNEKRKKQITNVNERTSNTQATLDENEKTKPTIKDKVDTKDTTKAENKAATSDIIDNASVVDNMSMSELETAYPNVKFNTPPNPNLETAEEIDAKIRYRKLKRNESESAEVSTTNKNTEDPYSIADKAAKELLDTMARNMADDYADKLGGVNMISKEQTDAITQRVNRLSEFMNTYEEAIGRPVTFNEVAKYIVGFAKASDKLKVFKTLQGIYVQINQEHEFVDFKDVFRVSPEEIQELETSKIVAKFSEDSLKLNEEQVQAFVEEFGNDDFLNLTEEEINWIVNNSDNPDIRIFKKGHNIVALLSSNYTVDENGTKLTTGELNENLNKNLLDEDFLDVDTEITFRVANDYKGDIYLPPSMVGQFEDSKIVNGKVVISYDTFKTLYGENSNEVIENIPIEVIVKNKKTGKNEVIGYIHAVEWINSDSIATERVEAERANMRMFRRALINNSNENGFVSIKSKVTDVSRRVLSKSKQGSDRKHVKDTANNHLGDKGYDLVFGDSKGNVIDQKGDNLNKGDFMNKRFLPGLMYASFYNKTHDKYIAIPLVPNKIEKGGEMSNSLINAIKIFYAYQTNSVTPEMAKAKEAILNAMQIDIYNIYGLIDYFNTFTHSYQHKGDREENKTKTLREQVDELGYTTDSSKYYLRTSKAHKNGSIEVVKSSGVGYAYITADVDTEKFSIDRVIERFRENLNEQFFNISKEKLDGKVVLLPSADNFAATEGKSYREFALDNVTTDVVNRDIGNGKSSIFNAPLISYNTNEFFDVTKVGKSATIPESFPVEPVIEEGKPSDVKRDTVTSENMGMLKNKLTGIISYDPVNQGEVAEFSQMDIATVQEMMNLTYKDIIKLVNDLPDNIYLQGDYIVFDASVTSTKVIEGNIVQKGDTKYLVVTRGRLISSDGKPVTNAVNLTTGKKEQIELSEVRDSGFMATKFVRDGSPHYYFDDQFYTNQGTESKLSDNDKLFFILSLYKDNPKVSPRKASEILAQLEEKYNAITNPTEAVINNYNKVTADLGKQVSKSTDTKKTTISPSLKTKSEKTIDNDHDLKYYEKEVEALNKEKAELLEELKNIDADNPNVNNEVDKVVKEVPTTTNNPKNNEKGNEVIETTSEEKADIKNKESKDKKLPASKKIAKPEDSNNIKKLPGKGEPIKTTKKNEKPPTKAPSGNGLPLTFPVLAFLRKRKEQGKLTDTEYRDKILSRIKDIDLRIKAIQNIINNDTPKDLSSDIDALDDVDDIDNMFDNGDLFALYDTVDAATDLNIRLKEGFLKDFNIDVQEYNSIKRALGYDANQMVSLVEKFIALEKGQPMDKAVAYIAYSLLGRENSKVRGDLRYNIYSWDKYKEKFNKYKNELYDQQGFIENTKEWKTLIRDKIIVDYLGETIVEYHNNPKEFEKIMKKRWSRDDYTFIKKLYRAIVKLLGLNRANSNKLANIGNALAHEILTREYDILDYKLDPTQKLKDYESTINSDPQAADIVSYMQDDGIILTGSLALRKAGKVYRTKEETLHDLDFVVPFEKTSENYKDSDIKSAKREYDSLGLDQKDGVQASHFLYKKFIEKSDWFKAFRAKYPSYRIVRQFVGSEHLNDFSSVTLTGVIDGEFDSKGNHIEGTGYIIDHFVRLAPLGVEHQNYFLLWKEIMVAKLMMARGKDFVDFKEFVPFTKSKDSYNFFFKDYVYQSGKSRNTELTSTGDLNAIYTDPELNLMRETADDYLLPHMNYVMQESVVSHIANEIVLNAIINNYTKVKSIKDAASDLKKQYENTLNKVENTYFQELAKIESSLTEEEADRRRARLAELNIKIKIDAIRSVVENWDNKLIASGGPVDRYLSAFGFVTSKSDLSALEDALNENDITDVSGEATLPGERNSYSNDWSLSINYKNNATQIVKKLLVGIPEFIDNTTKEKKAWFSIPSVSVTKVKRYDEVYNTLTRILSGVKPSLDSQLAEMAKHESAYPWLSVVSKILRDSKPEVKHAFTSAMSKSYVNMKFIKYRISKSKAFNSSVIDSSIATKSKDISLKWNNNIKSSDLIGTERGTKRYYYDKDVAKKLIATATGWVNGDRAPDTAELSDWLNEFGIDLHLMTLEDIENGYYNNSGTKRTRNLPYWDDETTEKNDIFRSKLGFVNHLLTGLKDIIDDNNTIYLDTSNVLDGRSVTMLASLDGRNRTQVMSDAIRTGGRNVYPHTANNHFFAQFRKLRDNENGLLDRLKEESIYAQYSKWLSLLLSGDAEFTNTFDYWMADLQPFKSDKDGNRRNQELYKLSPTEIEAFRISMFQKMKKSGEVRDMNIVYPTNSDKTRIIGITATATKVLVDINGDIQNDTIDEIYRYVVLPELMRAVHNEDNPNIDISGYKEGAGLIYSVPEIRAIPGLFSEDGSISPDYQSESNVKAIKDTIRQHIKSVVDKKLQTWEDLGIGGEKGEYLNARYMRKVANISGKDTLGYLNSDRKAATDMVVNYMIANANIFQLFVGDPAVFFKSSQYKSVAEANNLKPEEVTRDMMLPLYKEEDFTKEVSDTFLNVGKRLAGDIAPGQDLAESTNPNETFRVAYLQDAKTISEAIDYYETLNLKGIADYKGIEGSDAQELTTLAEHLKIQHLLGRISEKRIEELTRAANANALTDDQLREILYFEQGESFQAMKPVFVENVFDNGVYKRVYIKSSAFPLIPQLTTGIALNKLRLAMESQGVDRVAFSTAVKVGNKRNPHPFIVDGDLVNEYNFDDTNSEELPRSGFRIQQEVPFKYSKNEIKRVSQASKLLFANLFHVDTFSAFSPELIDIIGEDNVTGEELGRLFGSLHKDIYEIEYNKLKEELITTDEFGSKINVNNLKEIMKREAVDRNFPKSVIDALRLDNDLKGIKYSPYSDKFESLLNAIVNSRVNNIKMPGKSYVLGSEEGFKGVKTLGEVEGWEDSGIKFFKSFYDQGGKLMPHKLNEDGTMKSSDILVPWNFKDKNGKLLDMKDYLNEDGTINEEMFDNDMLTKIGMRIPNQGHNSMMKMRIVGFLPPSMGDLLIGSKDLTKQMGSDFDVDKLFTYNKFYEVNSGSKRIVKYTGDDVVMNKKNLMIDIFNTVLSNPDKLVQNYIAEPLGFWELKDIAKDIVDLKSQRKSEVANLDTDNLKSIDITETQADELSRGIRDRMVIPDEVVQDLELEEDVPKHILLDGQVYKIIYKGKHTAGEHIRNKDVPRLTGETSMIASLAVGEEREYFNPNNNLKANLILISKIRPDTFKFSPFSDDYQRTKFINATAGKAGVGVFSVHSTFNAQLQFIDSIFLTKVDNGQRVPFFLRFGNNSNLINNKVDITSPYTLESQRKLAADPSVDRTDLETKTVVISGYQSGAVDNEKEQILDKLNINSATFKIIGMLNQMGFAKEVPYLISQDIMVDYANLAIRIGEEDAAKAIKDKYTKLAKDTGENLDNQYASQYKHPSIDMLQGMLEMGPNHPEFYKYQLATLDTLLEVNNYGKQLTSIQNALNVDSKGIPKSSIEASSMLDVILDIISPNKFKNFQGIEKLIDSFPNDNEDYSSGTILGAASSISLPALQEFFGDTDIFPYSNYWYRTLFDQYSSISKRLTNDDKIALTKSIKSLIFTNPHLGIYEDGDINELRRKMLIDTDTNESLAKVLERYKKANPSIYIGNQFLNRLSTSIEDNGKDVSTITYDAAKGEDYIEDGIYASFSDLFFGALGEENVIQWNGEPLDLKRLGELLVAYSYITGGLQQAREYNKYIPIAYLHSTPFMDTIKNLDYVEAFPKVATNSDNIVINDVYQYTPLHTTLLQHLQNNYNPNSIKIQVDTDKELSSSVTKVNYSNLYDIKVNAANVPVSFRVGHQELQRVSELVNDVLMLPSAISLDDYIYVLDSDGVYNILPKVGTSGVKEYLYDSELAVSKLEANAIDMDITKTIRPIEEASNESLNINTDKKENVDISNEIYTFKGPNIDDNSLFTFGEIIEKSNNEGFKALAGVYRTALSSLNKDPNVKLSINLIDSNKEKTHGLSKMSPIKVRNGKIELSLNIPDMSDKRLIDRFSRSQLESLILHEYTHLFSALPLRMKENGMKLDPRQEAAIKSITSLRSTMVKRILSGKVEGLNYNDMKESFMRIQKVLTARGNSKFTDKDLIYYGFYDNAFNDADFSNMTKVEFRKLVSESNKVDEFITASLTNEQFQVILSDQKLPNNRSFKSQLMDLLGKLLSAFNIDISTSPLLAQAFNDSFTIMRYLPNNTSSLTTSLGGNDLLALSKAQRESKFASKIEVNNQILKRKNRQKNRLKTARKKATTVKEKNDITKKLTIVNEDIRNIENESNTLLKLTDFDVFHSEVAVPDIQIVSKIANMDPEDFKPKHSVIARELISLYKFAGDFSNPNTHPFLDADELEDIERGEDGNFARVKDMLQSYSNEVSSLEAKLVLLERNAIEKKANETFGRTVEIDWLNPKLDASWLSSQTLDISEYGNPLLDSLHAWVKLANARTREESGQVFEDVDKLIDNINNSDISLNDAYDLMLQRQGDRGKLTGNLVMPFSDAFYKAKSRVSYVSSDITDVNMRNYVIKKALRWSSNNEIVIDPSLEGDSRDEMINKLKEIVRDDDLVEEVLKEASDKYDDYLLDKEAFKQRVKLEYSYQGQEEYDFIIKRWEQSNSPVIRRQSQSDISAMYDLSEGYARPDNTYIVSVPTRKNSLGDTGWYDDNYAKIKEHPEAYEFYKYFRSKLGELNSYLPYDKRKGVHKNYIPAMSRTLMEEYFANGAGNAFTAMFDNVNKALRVTEVGNEDYSYRDPITNVPVKEQQVKYLIDNSKRINLYVKNKVSQYKAANNDDPSVETTRGFREDIIDIIANEKSSDLGKVLKAYSIMALGLKHKNEVEDSVRLAETMLNNMLAAETNKQGDNKIDAEGKTIGTKGKLDNTKKSMDHFLKAFYGYALRDAELPTSKKLYTKDEKARVKEIDQQIADTEEAVASGNIPEDEGLQNIADLNSEKDLLGGVATASRFGDSVLKWVQLKGMAWNIFSAFANLSFGIVSTLATAASERKGLYDIDNVIEALPIMLHSIRRNYTFNSKKYSTPTAMKVRNLMEKFDTLKDSKAELYNMSNNNSFYGNWTKRLKFLTPYNQQTRSEYLIQGLDMVALMMATKVGDSTLWESYDSDGNWIGDGDQKAVEDNYKLNLDKVIKINHGNYDADSVLLVKKKWFGRAASQFRTWMFEGYNQRYGKERFDNQLNLVRKGRHLTGIGVVSWKGTKDLSWFEATHFNTVKMLKRMRMGYLAKALATNEKFTDENGNLVKHKDLGFSDVDIANVKSNVAAMIMHASMMLFGLLLNKLSSDDDDDETGIFSISLNIMLNQLNRIETDMKFYFSPFEVQKLNKNILPVFQVFDDLGKLYGGIVRMVDGDPYFNSGIHKDDHIALRRLLEGLPYTSGILKLEKSATYLLDPDDRKKKKKKDD